MDILQTLPTQFGSERQTGGQTLVRPLYPRQEDNEHEPQHIGKET
mgnify:CR=1 FL=1